MGTPTATDRVATPPTTPHTDTTHSTSPSTTKGTTAPRPTKNLSRGISELNLIEEAETIRRGAVSAMDQWFRDYEAYISKNPKKDAIVDKSMLAEVEEIRTQQSLLEIEAKKIKTMIEKLEEAKRRDKNTDTSLSDAREELLSDLRTERKQLKEMKIKTFEANLYGVQFGREENLDVEDLAIQLIRDMEGHNDLIKHAQLMDELRNRQNYLFATSPVAQKVGEEFNEFVSTHKLALLQAARNAVDAWQKAYDNYKNNNPDDSPFIQILKAKHLTAKAQYQRINDPDYTGGVGD